MVTTPGGSRPAPLTQAQVDDLARGDQDDVARILRSTPPTAPPDEAGTTEMGSRPVDLSAKDIEAIRRSGVAPGRLAKRISEESRTDTTPAKGRGGAGARKSGAYPTVSPPGAGRRTSR